MSYWNAGISSILDLLICWIQPPVACQSCDVNGYEEVISSCIKIRDNEREFFFINIVHQKSLRQFV